MRILFCNYEYPPLGGGGGVVNALLAEELAQRHDVTVLSSRGLGLAPKSEHNGVKIVRVPVFFRTQRATANFPSMLAFMPMGTHTGKRLIRHAAFDVINTHFVLPSGPVGHTLARRAGIPNVLSVHGGDLYDPSKRSSPHRHAALRAWVRTLIHRADRVVGQSRNTIANLHQYYDATIRCERIPLGIARPPLQPAARSDYGFGPDDVLLATVGRLIGRKAVEQLVAAMPDLNDAGAHLLIVGSGPQQDSLRRQANELGIEKRVHFLGNVSEEEKFRVLNMSDLFVSASQHEGFGLVFLEAMACGLPIICYDHGGQTDFLDDGRTGRVVGLNDHDALRRACRELVENSDSRGRMAEENRTRMEDLYIDRCAARYEDLFREVMDKAA